MPTVTLNAVEYQSYATIADADAYLAASLAGSAWATLSDDQKAVRLVEAARVLNRQAWKPAYSTFESRTAVDPIVSAAIEMAASLAGDEPDTAALEGEAGNIRREKAASVEVEYFRSFDPKSRFSGAIGELLAPYLVNGGKMGGSRSIGGVFASGTDGDSTARDPWGFTRGV